MLRHESIKSDILSKIDNDLYIPTLDELKKTDKIIWSYWSGSEKPLSVKLAIHTWKKHNPDFYICILSESDLSTYVDINTFPKKFPKLGQQHKADIVRLALLEKYGGFWLDSTIFLTQPLSIMWNIEDYEIGGYYADFFTTDMTNPVLENWFLSAPKNSNVIKKWKEEFYKGIDYDDPNQYIKDIESEGIDLQKIGRLKTYLMMHCSFLKIIKNQNYTWKLYPAGYNNGPSSILAQYNWNSLFFIIFMLNNNSNQAIVKLRGGERKILDNLWFIMKKNSYFYKLLK
jgi:hypothetical protein